ncbi:MAG TPA: ABC transporter ATP-binding protein [Casimicrobiaceae bacterium]|nr:ABC transporter ATP-binding protein [Casimicrobiaceae bacterium]
MSALLEVRDLSVEYRTGAGVLRAVDDLAFTIDRGETIAIVGESGSGKSTAALALLRLLPDPPGRIVAGEIVFAGRNLAALPDDELRDVRGREVAMIFQDPLAALNPIQTIGAQIVEMLRRHRRISALAAEHRAVEMLGLVGMPSPEQMFARYPHQLSGGMRQRAMIGIALMCHPQLLVADEPTSALDVTVQAQVLELLASLKRRLGMALLLITHDLAVVAEIADRVVVMYGGRKVEEGPVRAVFAAPRHPYTMALLDASRIELSAEGYLAEIPEPMPSAPPGVGCSFAPRCPRAVAKCLAAAPALEDAGPERKVACFRAAENVR